MCGNSDGVRSDSLHCNHAHTTNAMIFTRVAPSKQASGHSRAGYRWLNPLLSFGANGRDAIGWSLAWVARKEEVSTLNVIQT